VATDFTERVLVHEGRLPLLGRVIGSLVDEVGVFYKLRVPNNGLWWAEGDWPHGGGGYQDYWVERESDCATECRPNDWVIARPLFRGPACPYPPPAIPEEEGQLARALKAHMAVMDREPEPTVHHYGYEIEAIDPLEVALRLEEKTYLTHPLDEGPRHRNSLYVRFPEQPQVDEWWAEWQDGLDLTSDAFSLDPSLLDRSCMLWICPCGEVFCGSIWARLEEDAKKARIIWREVTRITGGGFDVMLGPSLSFDKADYLLANAKVQSGGAKGSYLSPWQPVKNQPTFKDYGLRKLR
jgi:hypothetical protein